MIQAAASLALAALMAAVPPPPREHATLCLDTLGVNRGAVCTRLSASLIDRTPDICICPSATATVAAPYCAPGQRPQAESAAYSRARYAAAQPSGSLFGKRFGDGDFCVAHP